MKETLKTRLEIGETLLCYDNSSIVEKVTVEAVDKKAKTATLSNNVIISRYPDRDGYFAKEGKGNYIICRWDEEVERFYTCKVARSRVLHFISDIQVGLLNRTSDLLHASEEDVDKIIKLNKYLTKVLEK